MLLELSSDAEFFTLLEMLKTEGRELYTLHHPRKSDRWLWKVDVEAPKTEKAGQMGLGLEMEMPRAASGDAHHAITPPQVA